MFWDVERLGELMMLSIWHRCPGDPACLTHSVPGWTPMGQAQGTGALEERLWGEACW